MKKALNKLYYEPEKNTALAGAYHLLRETKNKVGKNGDQKVKDWLLNQDAYTLHKLIRKKAFSD